MSYHNGSVWPHDNALIALGLASYGQTAAVLKLLQGLIEAATYDEFAVFELFCGFSRRRKRRPTAYPVACSPRAGRRRRRSPGRYNDRSGARSR